MKKMSSESIKKKQINKEKLVVKKQAVKIDVFAAVFINLFLFVFNIIISPGFLWVMFPIIGWMIFAAIHAESYVTEAKETPSAKRWFIFDLTCFILTQILLYYINWQFSPGALWVFYPFIGWLMFLSVHFISYISEVKDYNPGATFMVIHATLFVLTSVLLFFIDFSSRNLITWSLYPFFFWGFALAGHIAIYFVFLRNEEYIEKAKKNKEERKKIRVKLKEKMPKSKPGTSKNREGRLISRWNKMMLQSENVKSKISAGLKFVGGKPGEVDISEEGLKTTVTVKPKAGKKPMKKGVSEVDSVEGKNLKELIETESEVSVELDKFICTVHRGSIDGTIYLCPECHSIYCEKCAKTLKLKDEGCWSCNTVISIAMSEGEKV